MTNYFTRNKARLNYFTWWQTLRAIALDYRLKKKNSSSCFLKFFKIAQFARFLQLRVTIASDTGKQRRRRALIGTRLSANCQGPGLIIFPRVRRLIRFARSDRKYQCFHVPNFYTYLHRCRRRRRQSRPCAEWTLNSTEKRNTTNTSLSTSRVFRESFIARVCRVGI